MGRPADLDQREIREKPGFAKMLQSVDWREGARGPRNVRVVRFGRGFCAKIGGVWMGTVRVVRKWVCWHGRATAVSCKRSIQEGQLRYRASAKDRSNFPQPGWFMTRIQQTMCITLRRGGFGQNEAGLQVKTVPLVLAFSLNGSENFR